MKIEDLRFYLTGKKKTNFFLREYENKQLLISSNINNKNLTLSVNRIRDDIHLIPEIKVTLDNVTLKYYEYNYNEDVYSKSEILAFLYASINPEWDVIRGRDRSTNKSHFYLKHENYIYDPSLAIITSDEMYLQQYKDIERIENKDVEQYVRENNNLYPYYKKRSLFSLFKKDNTFSIRFVEDFKKKFSKKVEEEYAFPEDIGSLTEYCMVDNFMKVRQALTQKRKYELEEDGIFTHPDIDLSV